MKLLGYKLRENIKRIYLLLLGPRHTEVAKQYDLVPSRVHCIVRSSYTYTRRIKILY